jgi:hypothetical protein
MTKLLPFFTEPGIQHHWLNNEDGTYTILSRQDVEPILDRNKALTTHNDGYNEARDLRRVASIPLILIHKWLKEEGWNALDPKHGDRLKKKLNSSEYLYLRTAPGRV